MLDRAVEGFDGIVGAREPDAAFHGDEDKAGEGVEVGVFGKAGPEFFEAFSDGGDPGGEVLGDEFMGGAVFGVDFEGEAAERAAVLAIGLENASAIAGEDGEDAFYGVGGAGEGGVDDDGAEGVQVGGEDGAKECFLAFEKVVEAAGVDLGVGQQVSHAGAGEAAFPEEIAGGFDEAFAGVEEFGHGEKKC